MTLAAGTMLGPFEVLAAIGAGGMGEVYRARDTRLKREVALKVLPDAFAQDPDRLARFQREAELLATLNHPNIATVHGLEQAEGVSAIVLELVEGDTLADLIARGPLPIADTLPIARQMADALEAAHDKGVIHRDLKPANIKVTADGRIKVLDFGLAKLLEADADPSSLTMSPTLSVQATRAGVILGTAAYMSPEQARGRRVDRRADIWAFGCVLFEMLTGRQAFDPGETVSDAIVSVLTKEPEWSALPADTPAHVRTLLRRCLQKDPQKRLPHIGVVRIEIEDGETTPAPGSATASPGSAALRHAAWRRVLPWVVAGVLAAGLTAVVGFWAPWRAAPSPAPQRLSVELGADVSLVTGSGAAAILSPDGQTLAFVARGSTESRPQLYVRRLDLLQAQALTGTDDARDPFFSPDGQWIAFFADGRLKKISVTGGAAVTLAGAPSSRGGVWAEDGTIAFQPLPGGRTAMPLMRVSAAGGTPEPLTAMAEGEITHRWPQILPGGRAVLFTAHSSTTTGYEDANIVLQMLPTGARKVLHRGGYYARYLASGHLVYMHEGTLFAAPFDLNRLELAGTPVPVLEGVGSSPTTGAVQFAVSDTGTLAYLQGQSVGRAAPIVWMDRQGKTASLRTTPADWGNLQFAPDGRLLALDILPGGASTNWEDVWIYDWARDTLSRLTFDPGRDGRPVWTPDGRRIAFRSQRGDRATFNLHWQRADGSGDVQRLTDSPNPQAAGSWHPSGRILAFEEATSQTCGDLMILPMEGDETSGWKPGKPTAFLSTPFCEVVPTFSPDGRWLSYVSNESGQNELYVRPFPGPGGKWQVSNGGAGPFSVWSRRNRELFYASPQPDARIMVASYTTEGNSFRADQPRPVLDAPLAEVPRGRSFDLHPDGQRFAMAPLTEDATVKQDKVILILNFFDELRRLAPVR